MEFSERIAHAYFFAKWYIIKKGYGNEIDWQDDIHIDLLSEQTFLREMAWVIIASGLSDKVVQKKYPLIRDAMFDFVSASLIVENNSNCINRALAAFNHKGKIEAIIFAANYINQNGFPVVRARLNQEGISFIKLFPYMGNATSYHLAKNIGLNYAKPDRHLVRISTALGFASPNELCAEISIKTNEKVSLIDLVLWRYATLDKNYLEKLAWIRKSLTPLAC